MVKFLHNDRFSGFNNSFKKSVRNLLKEDTEDGVRLEIANKFRIWPGGDSTKIISKILVNENNYKQGFFKQY